MGFVVSPTSHYPKTAVKRVPVYGIGIEVEGSSRTMDGRRRQTSRAVPLKVRHPGQRMSVASVPSPSPLILLRVNHPGTIPIPNVRMADLA